MSGDRFIRIASSGSTIEAEQVVQYLKENGITAYRKSEIMNIYMGNSMAGEDIMVSEKDRELAKKIINEFQPIKTYTTGYKRKLSKRERIIELTIIMFVVLFIMLSLLLLFLS